MNKQIFFILTIFHLTASIVLGSNTIEVQLSEAVHQALESHPSIKMSRSNTNMARLDEKMAFTNFLPKVSSNTYLTRSDMTMLMSSIEPSMPRNTVMIMPDDFWLQDITVMIPLFTGGRNLAQMKKTRYLYQASQQDLYSSQLVLSMRVKESFRMAQYSQKQTTAYQQMELQASERLENSKTAFNAGKTAKTTVLRDEAELAKASRMKVMAETDYQTALVRLRSLLGLSSDTPLVLKGDSLEPLQNPFTRESLNQKVWNTNPQYSALSIKREAARMSVSENRANLFPQISFMGMQDWYKKDMTGKDSGYAYGLVMSFPFFGSGETLYQVNQARESLKMADYILSDTQREIQSELDSQWLTLEAAQKVISFTQKELTSSLENERIMDLAYRAGKRTQQDYLEAVALRYQAEANHAQACLNYNLTLDQLYFLTGSDPLIKTSD